VLFFLMAPDDVLLNENVFVGIPALVGDVEGDGSASRGRGTWSANPFRGLSGKGSSPSGGSYGIDVGGAEEACDLGKDDGGR